MLCPQNCVLKKFVKKIMYPKKGLKNNIRSKKNLSKKNWFPKIKVKEFLDQEKFKVRKFFGN